MCRGESGLFFIPNDIEGPNKLSEASTLSEHFLTKDGNSEGFYSGFEAFFTSLQAMTCLSNWL